jgi:mRNA interferase RelE/StbE
MSTGPTYRIEFKPSAKKALDKLPTKARVAIGLKIDTLTADPRPHGYIKLVDQDGLYRVRSGNYRIVYSIHDDALVVEVVKVADRKEAY